MPLAPSLGAFKSPLILAQESQQRAQSALAVDIWTEEYCAKISCGFQVPEARPASHATPNFVAVVLLLCFGVLGHLFMHLRKFLRLGGEVLE
jgi:hypothetical protein